ncbi:MAG: cyclic nucleotide-binding domain-containing protein [Chloroflexota bacterium]
MISSSDFQAFRLFRTVDAASLQALAGAMRRRSFPANTVLFRKGDPGDTMYLIVSGQVRVFLHDDQGNEITLRTLGAGQILGEYSTLDRKPRSASASALTPLDALVLQRADFLNLLRERPLVGIELMRSIAERVRYATSYLERLYDAVELLSNNAYDQAILEMALSSDEDEMRDLIAAFLAMVHSVRARSGDMQ